MFWIEVDECTAKRIDVIKNPELMSEVVEHERWQIKDEPFPCLFVSTVFLGIDHSFGKGSPVLWETCAFFGNNSEVLNRYTSRADAIQCHRLYVEAAKKFGMTKLGPFHPLLKIKEDKI